jgi:hypothetical protein
VISDLSDRLLDAMRRYTSNALAAGVVTELVEHANPSDMLLAGRDAVSDLLCDVRLYGIFAFGGAPDNCRRGR